MSTKKLRSTAKAEKPDIFPVPTLYEGLATSLGVAIKRVGEQQGLIWQAMNVCNLIAEVIQDENADVWGSALLASKQLELAACELTKITNVMSKAIEAGRAAWSSTNLAQSPLTCRTVQFELARSAGRPMPSHWTPSST